MRIKSPFKDYYDGLAATDQEPEPLYVRKTWEEPTLSYGYIYPLDGYAGVIGWCGRIIPFCMIAGKVCYTVEESRKQAGKLAHSETFFSKWGRITNHFAQIHNVYLKSDDKSTPARDIFDKFDVPVFAVTTKLILNPRLNNFDFAKIVPPYQAWSDLTVYLSNKAQPNPTIPKVSDKDMIVAKGFDKWSFRKPPQG